MAALSSIYETCLFKKISGRGSYSVWLEGFSNRLPSQSSFDDGLLDDNLYRKLVRGWWLSIAIFETKTSSIFGEFMTQKAENM